MESGPEVQHQIEFVEDEQLPEGTDWAMVEARGDYLFVVKRSRVCPAVLEEAWEAFILMTASAVPQPRSA